MNAKKSKPNRLWHLVRRRPIRSFGLVLLLILSGIALFHRFKPLPPGFSLSGTPRATDTVQFLRDLTYVDDQGTRHTDQQIFAELYRLIDQAQHLILIDMFLFNDFQGSSENNFPPLSKDLTDRLIRQKQKHPTMTVLFITDPVNTIYGGVTNPHLEALQQAGIQVVMTPLQSLRDSNPSYSAVWRLFFQPWGNGRGSWLPNPFGNGGVSLRSYLQLLNFKANHRKVFIADSDAGLTAMVTSANPHDGSHAHGNVALRFSGPAARDLLSSERALLRLAGGPDLPLPSLRGTAETTNTRIQIVTEGAIRKSLLAAIDQTQSGDELDMVMFYLADKGIIKALKQAQQRGVRLRLILDPNKDAFGRTKNGVPNRPVAWQLHQAGVPIRWAATHGEQCHSKLTLIRYQQGTTFLSMGSANLTRRNIQNYNLETNAVVQGSSGEPVFIQTQSYVNRLWNNQDGQFFTESFEAYRDDSLSHRWLYWFMETTGWSTF